MKNKTQQEHENMPIAAQNANEADTSEEKITDEMWQAIVRNDLPYDDKFFLCRKDYRYFTQKLRSIFKNRLRCVLLEPLLAPIQF
jgi:hypothetical protein